MALLAGIYELWFSSRPAHAVVNQYPDLCRQLKANWAVGLCNAVLRKAAQQDVKAWREQQIPQISYSVPGWLWQQWRRQWGDAAALQIAQASSEQAPLTLRFNPQHYNPTSALAALEANGIRPEREEYSNQRIMVMEVSPSAR